jgi:murein DD-endopeptidase MepM/ murein hydrolase activator NlpD
VTKRRVALVFIAALLVVPAPAVEAKTTTTRPPVQQKQKRQAEIKEQLQSLRQQVAEASEEEAQLLDQLDAVEARRRTLDGTVADFDRRIGVARAELDTATLKLAQLETELRRTQAKLAAAQSQLTDAKKELHDRAVAAYVHQPGTQVAGVLLKTRSIHALSATSGYLESVVQAQARSVRNYRGLRDEIDDLRLQMRGKVEEAESQRAVVASRTTALESARKKQDSVRQQVKTEEVTKERLVTAVQAQVKAAEAQIKQLEAESASITAFLRTVQQGQGPVAAGKGILGMPVTGSRITSGFGNRVHPIAGTQRMHTGIDFGAGSGTPIRAAGSGVVVFAGSRGGYGSTTVIDHGGSLATLYAHQSRILVAEGQQVTRGQVIGAVGSTGYSTGPHLHFEVRANGTPVDPLRYL